MNIFSRFFIVAFTFCLFACEKEKKTPESLIGVNVVHAGLNAGTILINNLNESVKWSDISAGTLKQNYNSSVNYSVLSDATHFQIVRQSDTLKKIFSEILSAKIGRIYSVYIIGATAPWETLVVNEDGKFKQISRLDSTLNVRVINLSPNAGSIDVNISTTPSLKEFSNVAYKESSTFKSYNGRISGATIRFEARSIIDKKLLASVNVPVNTYRFKNITLMLTGNSSGTPATSLTIVKNY